MGKKASLRSKAVNLVSDVATVLLNPISDKHSHTPHHHHHHHPPPSLPPPGNEAESERSEAAVVDDSSVDVDGPDTSSFKAFLFSLLKDDYFTADKETVSSSSSAEAEAESEIESENANMEREGGGIGKPGKSGKRGILQRGRQTVSKAMSYAAKLAWYRDQASKMNPNSEPESESESESDEDGGELGESKIKDDLDPPMSLADLPEMSEPSMLLQQDTRMKLYASLPSLVRGRKWVLLYSTWRHGISLSTLYRRSNLCPGPSLLVVGGGGGAIFGGLVEAPLKPNIKKKYQGSASSFLFTDASGQPVIYRPTGSNRYYTLCSPEFLALGGGRHFALYLDDNLAVGSSATSETYGNPCLAFSEDFKVKDVELWGFAYASRYEEVLALSHNEPSGICTW